MAAYRLSTGAGASAGLALVLGLGYAGTHVRRGVFVSVERAMSATGCASEALEFSCAAIQMKFQKRYEKSCLLLL